MIGKEKLVFDASASPLSENDNVGAYLRASDGTLLTHTGGSLNANITNTVTVTATDFDIRDLSHVQDSVRIGDGTDFLAINADGSINVNADISVVNGHEKVEDAAHSSGDIGSYMLSVRQDTLAGSTDANGDYQSIKTDSVGALWARISQMPAPDAPNTAFNTDAVAVDDTAGGTQLIASPLASRKKLLIQNLGNRAIFIIESGQTIADGIRIAAGGNWEVEAGPAIDLYAITATGSADVRYFELA